MLEKEERVVAGPRHAQVLAREAVKVREEANCIAHRLIHQNNKGHPKREEIHLRTTTIVSAPQLMQLLMVEVQVKATT